MKKEIRTKLRLNKRTVARLDNEEMYRINAGADGVSDTENTSTTQITTTLDATLELCPTKCNLLKNEDGA